MAKKFLSPIGLPSGTSNPATGTAGELFYRTDLASVVFYNGTTWQLQKTTPQELFDIIVELSLTTETFSSIADGGSPSTAGFLYDMSGGNP